ncbi:C1 family peptidase [Maribellus maritimus]|uniref:C1 family peptidase n=1 Tax=Maribellus maritimus TaxID=2870838 RepID=UPI001EEBCCF9|nr:C1 family peptidase [Maribellus maritimus]MCG6188763.1 C1 family peptidase [Maribellus maritimus]
MRKVTLYFILIFFLSAQVPAQDNQEEFEIIKELKHTPVISQGSTGTCWSFATTSFLESEIMRKGFPETDLSEMYFVYMAYLDKAKDYLLYYGKNNFSEGGQAHDVLNVLKEHGMVTFESYPGVKTDGRYNHHQWARDLNDDVEKLNKKRKNFSAADVKPVEKILKEKIGKLPNKVKTDEGTYTPSKLRDKFKLNADDYVELTSYNHHPFYSQFVLEVPDNWSNDLYYNLPIDELMEVITYAIDNGYTVAWDGDTSEKTFTHNKGIANLPEKQLGKVDQKMRQETFFDRTTTDDHLMHIVGLSKNSSGQTCFYTKNSWGADSNNFGGYLHMTEDYVRLKTIAIMVHKNAIPKSIKKKIKL